jgi:hypothetical protein
MEKMIDTAERTRLKALCIKNPGWARLFGIELPPPPTPQEVAAGAVALGHRSEEIAAKLVNTLERRASLVTRKDLPLDRVWMRSEDIAREIRVENVGIVEMVAIKLVSAGLIAYNQRLNAVRAL